MIAMAPTKPPEERIQRTSAEKSSAELTLRVDRSFPILRLGFTEDLKGHGGEEGSDTPLECGVYMFFKCWSKWTLRGSYSPNIIERHHGSTDLVWCNLGDVGRQSQLHAANSDTCKKFADKLRKNRVNT